MKVFGIVLLLSGIIFTIYQDLQMLQTLHKRLAGVLGLEYLYF